MQGYVLAQWTTVQSSLTEFTQDEEEWLDLGNYGDCAFWLEVAELTTPGGGGTVKLALETAPLAEETLFQPVVPDVTLAASLAPTIVKSVRTPTTAPLSRWLRWKLKAPGASSTWSATFRIRAVPGKSSFFSPMDTSGCQLWLRGDLGVTFNGANVSAWADQSGNANNAAQGDPAAQPGWSATAMNGFPAITGDGTAKFMTTSSMTFGSDATLITAVRAASVPQTPGTRLVESRYDTSYYLGTDIPVGTVYKLVVNNPTPPYGVAEGGVIATRNQIVSGVYSSTTSLGTLYLDGAFAAQDTFTAPSSVSTPLYVMRAFSYAGSFWNGYLGEVILYDRALDAAELLRVHKYLGNRYGVVITP